MKRKAKRKIAEIKVARTIADLEGVKDVAANHIAEVLQYRPKDSETF